MKKHVFYLSVLFLLNLALNFTGFSQVGIGIEIPDASSMLDITSTTKGFLTPRMTTAQRTTLGTIAVDGLLVYDTDFHAYFYYRGGDINAWEIQLSYNTGWSLTGNGGTNSSVNFIGTTDGQDLVFKVNNQNAGRLSSSSFTTLFGYQAGDANIAGHNTFVGWAAGKANTSGDNNIAYGCEALSQNTKGSTNIAVGFKALSANTTAGNNVAVGNGALSLQSYSNGGFSYSTYNTAIGIEALYTNQPAGTGSSGSNNTATGYRSLFLNTTGSRNVANGGNALYSNTVGPENSAFGFNALQYNTVAGNNVAVGNHALKTQSFNNGGSVFTSGNTAIGYNALTTNQPTSSTNGIQNSAVGFNALQYNTIGFNNTALGNSALLWNTEGYNNTAIGYAAFSAFGVLYNNSTALGADAQIYADNQVRLGNDAVTSLFCNGAYAATSTNGPNLYIDSDGQFFRSTSGGKGWLLEGNAGIDPANNFIGTTDAQPLVFKTNSTEAMQISATGNITMTKNVQTDGKLTTVGGLFVGPNSTGIASIITNAVAMDCPGLAGQSSATVTATFSDVTVNSTVFISPQNALPGSVLIAHARISAANTLEVKFTNAGSTTEDPPNMTFYVTVFN